MPYLETKARKRLSIVKSAAIVPAGHEGFYLIMCASFLGSEAPFGATWHETEAEAMAEAESSLKIKPADWVRHDGDHAFGAALGNAAHHAMEKYLEATAADPSGILEQAHEPSAAQRTAPSSSRTSPDACPDLELGSCTSLEERLAQFRRVLEACNPEGARALRPGLSRRDVEERLARLPFQISPDAVALYMWADGAEGALEILPGAHFVSLDEAVSEFLELWPMRDDLDAIFPQPYRHSLRFLSDYSDGGYALGRLDSPSRGMVVHLCIHQEWALAYSSVDKLFETAIECRRRGVFIGDEVDFYLYYEVARELNPGMEAWEAEE
jgi:hypothetical protein